MFEISYCQKSNTLYIVFNNIECIFGKIGINKYLVICENNKNEKMLKNYTTITDELKDQILFIVEDKLFVLSKDFTRFKFKTDDKLPYNKKINAAVCVILLGSVFEERNWYNPQVKLQKCFYEK